MQLERAKGVALLWTALALSSGCLVTNDVDVTSQPNYPPSIVSPPSARQSGTALDQIVWVTLGADTDADRTQEIVFPVTLRDPNVWQTLYWQVFVDFQASSNDRAAVAGGSRPPDGDLDRGFEFSVPAARLRPAGRCHKVELLVSSGFIFSPPFREPRESGDLASAVWWVHATDVTHPEVDMSTCP